MYAFVTMHLYVPVATHITLNIYPMGFLLECIYTLCAVWHIMICCFSFSMAFPHNKCSVHSLTFNQHGNGCDAAMLANACSHVYVSIRHVEACLFCTLMNITLHFCCVARVTRTSLCRSIVCCFSALCLILWQLCKLILITPCVDCVTHAYVCSIVLTVRKCMIVIQELFKQKSLLLLNIQIPMNWVCM